MKRSHCQGVVRKPSRTAPLAQARPKKTLSHSAKCLLLGKTLARAGTIPSLLPLLCKSIHDNVCRLPRASQARAAVRNLTGLQFEKKGKATLIKIARPERKHAESRQRRPSAVTDQPCWHSP